MYGIPLQLFPFPYSDELMLHDLEQKLCMDNFDYTVRLPINKKFTLKKDNHTLYINHWRVKVDINWNDSNFVALLKETIAPRNHIDLVAIPQGYLSVALHVRKGGVFVVDTVQEQERCPLRFVPEEFFVEQIKRIVSLFPDEKLYVYIFTDYSNPKKLAKKFSALMDNENIIFDYHKEENNHKVNVLEDFFSMMQFDCLIRTGSHFSRFVERLGNAKLVVYPYSSKKEGKRSVIDVIGVKTRDSNGKWKTEKISIS
jgi:hypothetical protein